MFTTLMSLIATTLVFAPIRASGQSSCESPNHHQLDFGIGTWTIGRIQPNGTEQPGESNVIEKAFGGCGLRESYRAMGDFTGGSITAYDAAHGQWHQLYTDASGAVVDFRGSWEGDHMAFLASMIGPKGNPFTMRLTMTPRADGSVRLFYETSRDGTTWKPNTDLIYHRATP